MKIKFLVDYIGRETSGVKCFKDDTFELSHQAALELVSMGVAEEISQEPIETRQTKKKKVTNENTPETS